MRMCRLYSAASSNPAIIEMRMCRRRATYQYVNWPFGKSTAGQRHEGHWQHAALGHFAFRILAQQQQVLFAAWFTDWNDHSAIGGQLFDQRWRDLRCCSGDDDGVERSFLRPAEGAVTRAERDVITLLRSQHF